MNEQLLDALLGDYGEYYGSILRLNLGSYAGTSNIDPEFEVDTNDDGTKFVKNCNSDKIVEACIDGFKNHLRDADKYEDYDIDEITVENLGDYLAREETIGYAIYQYETWLNEDNNDESDEKVK